MPGGLASKVGWEYFPVAFAGRLPYAMMIVGVLTLVATLRGSVAEAGLSAAAAGLGTAIAGPASGVLADRLGQRVVLLALAARQHPRRPPGWSLLGYAGAPLAALLRGEPRARRIHPAGGAVLEVAAGGRRRRGALRGDALAGRVARAELRVGDG